MPENNEDISKLNKELTLAKKKLEELNHFKTHLLTLASHQFKAPLAAIKGYSQLAESGEYGPVSDEIKTVLRKMRFAAQELIDLVENVIDIRKIEEGRMIYSFEKVDLGVMVGDIVSLFSPLARGRGLELSFEHADGDFLALCDKIHIRHAIQNLIDNALKYTPKGFVKVGLGRAGKDIVFSVKDSGIGIKPGTSPLLFEEFTRDERVKKDIRGSGIGLHVAKSTVEAHGGKIWAESEGEGMGSTFSFSVPAAA